MRNRFDQDRQIPWTSSSWTVYVHPVHTSWDQSSRSSPSFRPFQFKYELLGRSSPARSELCPTILGLKLSSSHRPTSHEAYKLIRSSGHDHHHFCFFFLSGSGWGYDLGSSLGFNQIVRPYTSTHLTTSRNSTLRMPSPSGSFSFSFFFFKFCDSYYKYVCINMYIINLRRRREKKSNRRGS